MKRFFFSMLAVLVLIVVAVLGIQHFHDPGSTIAGTVSTDPAQQIRQGGYVAQAANCMACHTVRGGAAYAGGRVIQTPFGNLHSPNITPDVATGIGGWNADEFWRALHNGKSRDGRFLYPAFPYTEYTKMTRGDSDALFAYLQSLPAVRQANQPHALRFPYDQRILLAAWRMLYFRPGVYEPDSARSLAWNRGAYLVQGPGHCSACHTARNALGATQAGAALGGGLMPMQGWYAPALTSPAEAGLAGWRREHIVALLGTGVSPTATVAGPMAEVVRQSLQHLSPTDLDAMALYLESLPQTAVAEPRQADEAERPTQQIMERGARLYKDNCVACHRENGKGAPPGYPPLAGNRGVVMTSAVNPIQIVLHGGFAPGTSGNPRPYGMPPYGPALDDADVATLLTYIRNSWGNSAAPVSAQEVSRYRAVPLH